MDRQTIEDYIKEILGDLTDFRLETFAEAVGYLEVFGTKLNSVFGQTKERLSEVMDAAAMSIPKVTRLNGDVNDVFRTMEDLAKASRRNIVASDEVVADLFAASKVLGESVSTIADSFLEVGVGLTKIPEQLEESAEYIRSIGGNTEQIMKSVTANMEQLNRFQFEGGVVGLTKMAAQSTMLRFNMSETFRLADKVLSPEGAVEVAAAFQRLGVTAGNLVDPFQLMNQSINDPQGLQNSLIEVAKQFSYFDEDAKTFRINPQGVLMLREIEQQTGVSARELSKAAVAAGELDMRLSAISMADLDIKEEDKQYLANIAQMDEGGEYVVKLRDEDGQLQDRKLQDITQEEFDKLIKEQKTRGVTLEDVARNQLTVSELVQKDVRAIHQSIVYGVTGAGFVTDFTSGLARSLPEFTGAASEGMTEAQRRLNQETDELYRSVTDILSRIWDGESIDVESIFLDLGNKFDNISDDFLTSATNVVKEGFKRQRDLSFVEGEIRKLGNRIGVFDSQEKMNTALNGDYSFLAMGEEKTNSGLFTSLSNREKNGNVRYQNNIDLDGNIKIEVVLPNNASQLNETQLMQTLDNVFNSEEFKKTVIDITSKKDPTKSRTSSSPY